MSEDHRRLASRFVLALVLVVLTTAANGPAQSARPHPGAHQTREPSMVLQEEPKDELSHRQKKDLLKHNLAKMKEDADELSALAKSLQEELDKTTENVLSLQIVDKADKIEKLAKRIKNNARGY